MSGYIHLTRLTLKSGTDNREFTEYQVNYVVSGLTYAIAYDRDELAHFLIHKVPLSEPECAEVIEELDTVGHANLSDVNIPKNEAASMGMEVLPDDY
jgi:hypothetical protein